MKLFLVLGFFPFIDITVAAVCPSACVCDYDPVGRRRVLCEHGGVNIPGNFDLTGLDPDTTVLVVDGPPENPNSFRLTSDMFSGKILVEIHLTNSQNAPVGNRLYQYVAPTLEVLNLSTNSINILTENMFRNLGRLKLLDLSHNGIEDLPSVLAAGSVNIEELDLSYNPIGDSLTDGSVSLAHFTALKILNIAGTGITSLQSLGEFLRSNARLEELDLSDNLISTIMPNYFNSILSLKRLNLANNEQLRMMASGAFSGTNLDSLDLSGISGDNLKVGIFNGAKIKGLILGNMSLTSLNPGILTPIVPYLTSLDLSGNEGIQLETGMFSGLLALTHLSLSGMSLTFLPRDLFDHDNNLEELDLSENELTSLDDEFFSHIPKLTSLNLANNKLAGVPFSIKSLPNIKSIDLSNNLITAFPESVIDALTDSGSSLTSLKLNDNPWQCNCGIATLARWLTGHRAPDAVGFEPVCVGNGNFSCPVCASPFQMRGTPLNALPEYFRDMENCAPEADSNVAAEEPIPSVVVLGGVALIIFGYVVKIFPG